MMKPANNNNRFPFPNHQSSSSSSGSHHYPVMGTPTPTVDPNNPKANNNGGGGGGDPRQQQPYIQYSPVPKPSNSTTNPMDSVMSKLNLWGNKAETTATNIYHNLKTGSSLSGAAWGKMNLTAKAITGGGFETLYKHHFPSTFPNEKLYKSFASYLSTSTGPVSGTLYLSNFHIAFCSDNPISFTSSSSQETWSHYKVMLPLAMVFTINPVVMNDNPSTEKYLQIVTVDGHDFWFMGFVNYEKASRHLTSSISNGNGGGPATGFPLHHGAFAS